MIVLFNCVHLSFNWVYLPFNCVFAIQLCVFAIQLCGFAIQLCVFVIQLCVDYSVVSVYRSRNRPVSKMAAKNSNRSILKTYTSTRKNTFT